MAGHNNNQVRVLEKAFGLLAMLNAERGLSVAALSRRLGIPRPTVNRILQSFMQEGLATRTPNDGLYCVTSAARELSRRVPLWPALEEAAASELKRAQKKNPWPLFVPAVLGDLAVVVASIEAPVHFLPRKMVRGNLLAAQSPLARWLRGEPPADTLPEHDHLLGMTGPESWIAVRIPLADGGKAALALRIPAAIEHVKPTLEAQAPALARHAAAIAAAMHRAHKAG
jgi:DNA-binding MarR family transcriptional regulator